MKKAKQGDIGPEHPRAPAMRPPSPTVHGDSLWLKIPFRGSQMNVRVEVAGQPLTKAHLERARQYLELAKNDLESDSND